MRLLRRFTLLLVTAAVGFTGCASAPTPALPETPDLAGAIQQAANADTAVVAFNQPAPCCKRQTLPQFLGVTGACNATLGILNNLRNRLGSVFPGLEATPPVLAITDPANLSEDAPPAVQTAAKVKAQEDQAAQKIKALRYLATIGCGGCYPDVEDALIQAMEDCTEEVRYEAVLAIRKTTGVNCCFCSHGACCSEKVQKKLRALAEEQSACCPAEPSARVRRQARLALNQCGPPVIVEEEEEEEPEEPDVPTEEAEDEEAGEGEGEGEGEDADTEEAEEDTDSARLVFPPPTVRAAAASPQPYTVARRSPRRATLTLLPPVDAR